MATQRIVDDLDALIAVLPERVQRFLKRRRDAKELIEVVMDLGRLPEARFPNATVSIGEEEATDGDIEHVVSRVGEFGDDNRAGIERTLHRISVIRNRAGVPVGLTCRVGRAVFGTIRMIEDLVMTGESLLLLGRPGVGKTTMLREVARVLADDGKRRVVIVDTSNEIAGDGDVPHPAIGHARRMQVPRTDLQHRLMIEAVENHMPEVIIIDEMSAELEALAARTIAERGVQLIATAHGNTLANVVSNPTLSDLVGGTQAVTLGDVEARRRRTQKTVLERRHEPTFDIVVEIRDRSRVAVHRDAGQAVDSMLRGFPTALEVRWLSEDGQVKTALEDASESPESAGLAPVPWQDYPFGPGGPGRDAPPLGAATAAAAPGTSAPTRVYPFGIARPSLEE
ncbi:MAG: AAA family ATPase, partial [Gemmatimonadetes bacterium]|nr:AAA family ATPase [Gemmatimonadota bacterium]